jgi:hypothetical protein
MTKLSKSLADDTMQVIHRAWKSTRDAPQQLTAAD